MSTVTPSPDARSVLQELVDSLDARARAMKNDDGDAHKRAIERYWIAEDKARAFLSAAPDGDARLPELPEPDVTSYQTDSVMRRMELRTFSARLTRTYGEACARAAIAIYPADIRITAESERRLEATQAPSQEAP